MEDTTRSNDVQHRRAVQYAFCAYAIRFERVGAGVEGVFDQALTNGLAAIVAARWKGQECNSKGRVESAAKLLKVVETEGVLVRDGVYWLTDNPHIPKPTTSRWDPFEERPPMEVRVTVLREALDVTQAIRHARDTGDETALGLTAAHVEALWELSEHPTLSKLVDDLSDGSEEAGRYAITAADDRERDRASIYLELLSSEELARRGGVDYAAEYSQEFSDVEECPVCGNNSLVLSSRDSEIDEIGVGRCVVCSYERTMDAANDIAASVQFERAVERAD
ncbi:hypothetical protein [Streptosporangium lutulentum]|uniref:Restriction endonuclease n=1 Tax=Streptosporangium lutulentum TaxID=1461250 RepID=A0ABT9QUI5_9ACTN|nr:hypothetical protein [Streptosporangium lutulentum]MDP9850422.1 hypothetical protein [Streptosporangium lutulentum]